MDELRLTAFEAHALIKACEALNEIESHGRYTQEEMDAARALKPRLAEIAGDVVDLIGADAR